MKLWKIFAAMCCTVALLAGYSSDSEEVQGKTVGGSAYYNGTFEDIQALKAKADKTGISFIEDESREYLPSSAEYVYESGDKYVFLTYNGWASELSTDNVYWPVSAQIEVEAYEGYEAYAQAMSPTRRIIKKKCNISQPQHK